MSNRDPLRVEVEVELLTVSQVARMLNVGRNRVYELAHARHLPTLRLGRSFRFPRRAVQRWIDEQAEQGRSG